MGSRREDLRLPDGTPLDEATSALIKTLRRGWELDALGWASLMVQRFTWKTWRTLATFAAEDIGPANPHALPLVMASRFAWEKHAEQSSARPPLVLLANAVLCLARSSKSREADDLAESMKHLIERGWRPALPEYAIDTHTARGRDLIPREQRLDQWLTEGRVIVPDTGPKDWHAWILRWAVQRGHLDSAEVEAQIADWQEAGRLRFGPDGYGSVREEEGDE